MPGDHSPDIVCLTISYAAVADGNASLKHVVPVGPYLVKCVYALGVEWHARPVTWSYGFHDNLTVTLTVTGVNNGEQARNANPKNWLEGAVFETPTNNHETLKPLSHGGGHEFESRRVHSEKFLFCR